MNKEKIEGCFLQSLALLYTSLKQANSIVHDTCDKSYLKIFWLLSKNMKLLEFTLISIENGNTTLQNNFIVSNGNLVKHFRLFDV